MSKYPVPASGFNVRKTEQEWRSKLTAEEYRVLRRKGTERASTGEYDKFYPKKGEGYFACKACEAPLYSAESKFNRWEECPHFLSPSGSPPSTCPCAISGCGWPAFDKCFKGAVVTKTDNAYGMRRVEIMCGNCGGHLGHVFEGERMTSTNERHCVNSVSVKFNPGTIPEGLEEDKVV